VGEQYLIDGDVGKARAAFQSSVATGVTEFLEYDWAQQELDRLNATK
jgi:lipoprotein NlpI